MKWQPIRKRKKLGLALLEEERTQKIVAAGLKGLFERPELESPELKPEVEIEETNDETSGEANEFVFMTEKGFEITHVKDLKELVNVIWNVPRKSVIYHINNDDFSKWFYDLGHKELAENVRRIKGDHKAVIKQLLSACNSALVREQQI